MDLPEEQLSLLSDLVEASRTLPSDKRQEFVAIAIGGQVTIRHPGLDPGYVTHTQDFDLLRRSDRVNITRQGRDVYYFYITPSGFRAYEQAKQEAGTSTERLETEVHRYIDGRRFRDRYPTAFDKWTLAEILLWGEDSDKQLSAIGHHCREALQQFVSTLVEAHHPPDVEANPALTINRLQAVLRMADLGLGGAEADTLTALITYWWRAVNGLVQRQTHAGQKEGRPVVWEDARSVVFGTM